MYAVPGIYKTLSYHREKALQRLAKVNVQGHQVGSILTAIGTNICMVFAHVFTKK